jgi:hypothetical protein
MKNKINAVLIVLVVAVLVLTVTGTSPIAFAVGSYLQLQSFDVRHANNAIDVQINTKSDVPTRGTEDGFGYAVLTDVGDQVEDALVASNNIGFVDFNEDPSLQENGFYTHILDLTRSVSGECEGSDYQVDLQSSVANEGFNLVYPVILGNNEITIEDIHIGSLAGENVKAVLSFTGEAISDGNNNDVQQICIDIQDIIQAGQAGQTNEQGNSNNKDSNVNDEDGDEQEYDNKEYDNKKNDRGDRDGETTGDETTGDETTGDETTGDETTGDETTGDETTGDETTGDETTDGETTDGDESLSQPTYTAPLNTMEEVSPDTVNPMDAIANY